MARLPDVTDLGRRMPSAQRAIIPGNSGVVAEAVGQVGATVTGIGDAILERESTAQAKERDVLVSDRIRALLYDPENGFNNLNGSAAVGARAKTLEELEKIRGEAVEGLNPTARRKIEGMLASRIESAKNSVDQHTSSARDTWISGASEARIESAYQDSLANIAATDSSLAVMEGEIRGRAAREGWAAEKLGVELKTAKSKVYTDQVVAMGVNDPVGAMEYARANKASILPNDFVNLENRIGKDAKRAIGDVDGTSAYDSRNVSAGAQAALATLERLTGETFKINSAYRDPGHNAAVGGAKGSQHIHGNAFDVDVSGKSQEERAALIRDARAAGFGGVGVYASALHFDVGPVRAWGPDFHAETVPAWAADAVSAGQGRSDQGSTDPMDRLARISDPVRRDAAMARYRELSALDAGRRKEFEAGLEEDLAYASANGSLPPDSRYSDQTVDMLYPPGQAEEVKRVYSQSVADAEMMYGVNSASADQLAQQVGSAVAAVQKPGHTAEDVSRLAGLQTAIESRNMSIEEDPAGHVTRSFRETGAALTAYDDAESEEKPAAARAYVAAADYNYDRIGVPQEFRSILPKQMAQSYAKQFNDMAPDVAAQSLVTFADDWGNDAPRLVRELGAAGLAPEYAVAMRHADNPGLSAQIVSLRGQTVESLTKGVPTAVVTDARSVMSDGMADYISVFEAGDATGEASRIIGENYAVAEKMALQMVRQGMDPSAAAEQAMSSIFPETVMDEPNAKVILPVGIDEGEVSVLLETSMTEDAVRAFNPAPMDDPRLPEFADREVMIAAAQDGLWLTNSTGDGAVLHLNVGGYYIPVIGDSGAAYEVKFGAAVPRASRGTSKSGAAP